MPIENGGVPGGTPGGTPGETPGGTPGGTPGETPGAAPAWHGFTEAADVAYVNNKGWKGPADAIASYRNAEKMMGRNPDTLMVIPKTDDPAAVRAAFERLGMPADPKNYTLDPGEGLQLDPAYQDWAKAAFHKAGLTNEQAKVLSAEYNQNMRAGMEGQQRDYETKVAADRQSLIKEWGAGHDRYMNSAKAAANNLGVTPEMIDALESVMGYAGVMKFFAGLGQKMSEDGFVSSDGNRDPTKFGAMLTPDEAKAQWDQLKLDENFRKDLFDPSRIGHKQAIEKQKALFALAFPN